MGEWKEYRFDEVANIVDCEHKTAPTIEKSDFYSVRTTNISSGKIDFDKCNRVDEDVYLEWTKRATPESGDIILAREAPVGEVGMIKDGYKVCLGQRTVLIKLTSKEINNYYLLYYLVNPANKNELIEMSGGSVVSHLNMKDIRAYELKVPPLPEQKAIASVLSSLDDKIDLLHRQNKTLEQMAETLFRQWFVEEAKEEWEEGVISDIADHLKINVKPQQNSDTLYAHFSIPGYDTGKEPVYELGREIKSNKYQVLRKSILFSKLNPHKDKRVWLLLEEIPKDSICSTEFQVIKPKDEKALYFIYGWLTNPMKYREIASGIGGTSGSHQRISPKEIFSFPVAMVPENTLEKYTELIEPIFQKININQIQIHTLESLRDTLLPKLMSGEVRVQTQRDETFVEKNSTIHPSSVGAAQKETHG